MKYITAEDFYDIIEASVRYFADCNTPATEEEVELQSFENWWYDFKMYMEDSQ